MIVTCSDCDTQFKLDDSKIAGNGLNVRCSVCKHAFFVLAPSDELEEAGADPSDAFNRVASAAIEAVFSDEGGFTPETTEDLFGSISDPPTDDGIATRVATHETADFVRMGDDDNDDDESTEGIESDWEFSREPEAEAGAAVAERKAATGVAAAAKRAVDDLLGQGTRASTGSEPIGSTGTAPREHDEPQNTLGDPEDWDFFGNEGGDLGQDSVETSEGRASSRDVPTGGGSIGAMGSAESGDAKRLDASALQDAAGAEFSAEIDTNAADLTAFPGDEVFQPIPQLLRRVGNILGWTSVLALITLGIHSGVKIQRVAPKPVETQTVAGRIVESLSGQWIENIFAGPLFVVSGILRNDGELAAASGNVLVVRMYDASGRPLDSASAMVGPALTERQIREDHPAESIARLELGAARASREPLARGERRGFHAILPDVPRAAVSFRLESAPGSLEVP